MAFQSIGKRVLLDLTSGVFGGGAGGGTCTKDCSTCSNAGSCGATSYATFKPGAGLGFEASGARVVLPDGVSQGPRDAALSVDSAGSSAAQTGSFARAGRAAADFHGGPGGLAELRAVAGSPAGAGEKMGALAALEAAPPAPAGAERTSAVVNEVLHSLGYL